jgi:hypothetical protein
MNTTSTEDVESRIKRKFEDRIKAKGLTRKAVYTAVGMSRNTFELKMAGGDFGLREVIRLALFLDLDLDELVH